MENSLDNGLTEEGGFSFRCACGIDYELPKLAQGQRVQCEECGAKYEMLDGELVALTAPRRVRPTPVRVAVPIRQVAPPKMPVVMVVAVSLVFVFSALCFLGTASQNAIGALSAVAVMVGLGLGLCRGRNWCRIALTALIGLVWVMACIFDVAAGITILLLWTAPLVLIWLPPSNEWFRQRSLYNRVQEQNNPKLLARKRLIRKAGLLLLAAACLYGSGFGFTMILDKVPLSSVGWKAGFVGFFPFASLMSLIYLIGAFFGAIPFVQAVVTAVLSCAGWGIVASFFPDAKEKKK